MIYTLSVVIPLYNDEDVIQPLLDRLLPITRQLSDKFEIIFIDDGSSDKTWLTLLDITKELPEITAIKFVKNFGQQNAIAAGLDYVTGDIVVIMDSDLQDKPEDIPLLINALVESDASMAIAKWITRKDGFLKKFVSRMFYKVTQNITNIHHQPNLGVFRAIKKEVVEELKKYNEKTSSTLSLLYWIGVDYMTVELKRDARFAGKSGYNIKKMLQLTFDRIFSFSMFPIRLATYSGFGVALISFVVGIILIIRFIYGKVAPGWTSNIVLILFLFGISFMFLGIIGEYLGRIFLESKQRPKYIIKKIINNK